MWVNAGREARTHAGGFVLWAKSQRKARTHALDSVVSVNAGTQTGRWNRVNINIIGSTLTLILLLFDLHQH